MCIIFTEMPPRPRIQNSCSGTRCKIVLMWCHRTKLGGPSWRHQMEIFSALLTIYAGNSPVSQRPVARSFDVFIDPRLDERLCKHPWGWWLETPSLPLWHQGNDYRPRRWPRVTRQHANELPKTFDNMYVNMMLFIITGFISFFNNKN